MFRLLFLPFTLALRFGMWAFSIAFALVSSFIIPIVIGIAIWFFGIPMVEHFWQSHESSLPAPVTNAVSTASTEVTTKVIQPVSQGMSQAASTAESNLRANASRQLGPIANDPAGAVANTAQNAGTAVANHVENTATGLWASVEDFFTRVFYR